ncbi:hypothetical protein FI667_g12325, partial [Globisporangium splendens]
MAIFSMSTRKVCPDAHAVRHEPPYEAEASAQKGASGTSSHLANDDTQSPGPRGHQVHVNSLPSSSSLGEHLVLNLSSSSRRQLWCFLLLYQLCNGFLLACQAVMYGTVARRGTLLWFLRYNFLFSKAQLFLTSVHRYVSVGYGILSAMFAYGAATMVWHSLRRKRFCYHGTSPPRRQGSRKTRYSRIIRPVVQVAKKTVNVYLMFGLRGKYFTTGFFIREVIESALQTTKAYTSSVSLSNAIVNQSYGVLIFLNCVACVALPWLFAANPTKARLVCVLVDLVLDYAWGTVLPLTVFWPYLSIYYRFYDTSQSISTVVSIDDVQQEVECILVLSTSDFILSMFPFMSSVANMRSIKKLISNSTPHKNHAVENGPVTKAIDEFGGPRLCLKKKCCDSRRAQKHTWSTICSHVLHGLMLVYGTVILIVSIASMHPLTPTKSATTSGFKCLHRVYPWFTTKEACGGRVIDCELAGINGQKDEITQAFEQYDEQTLSTIELVHCSNLEVSPSIHRFPQLSVVTIRHSSVYGWGSDAAVTDEFFHSIQTIRIVNATFVMPPDGILDNPLPALVEWISITDVDISTLVDRIGDKWRHLKYFYCDSCNLVEFPEFVVHMTSLLELSLMCNAIPAIEERHFEPLVNLENLWIDGLPFTSLPDSLWRICFSLGDFSCQNTNLSGIPSWVRGGENLRMYGFGTPLCKGESKSVSFAHLSCEESVY